MKRRILTILPAAVFCLSLLSQQASAKTFGVVVAMDKPDIQILSVLDGTKDFVEFTVVSHGSTVPAKTVGVEVWIREPNSQAMFYDYVHKAVIDKVLYPEVKTVIQLSLPPDKLLTNRKFNLYIDSGNNLDESDEANNVSATISGFTGQNAPSTDKPDIEVVDSLMNSKTSVSLSVVSREYAIPAGTISVLVSADNKDGSAAWLKQEVISQQLDANALTKINFQAPQGKDFAQKKYRVTIDALNKVEEYDEQNNHTGPFVALFVDDPVTGDLKFKEELYFRLGQPDSQAGTPTSPLKVKKSQTVECSSLPAAYCANLTARILKTPASANAVYTLKVTNTTASVNKFVSGQIGFGQTTGDVTIYLRLKEGANKLSLEIIPEAFFTDSDGANNKLEITVNLLADK